MSFWVKIRIIMKLGLVIYFFLFYILVLSLLIWYIIIISSLI
jgi:hypothetical protein